MKESENTFVINVQVNVDKQALADIENLAENLRAIQRAGRHPDDARCAELVRCLAAGTTESERLSIHDWRMLLDLANRLEVK